MAAQRVNHRAGLRVSQLHLSPARTSAAGGVVARPRGEALCADARLHDGAAADDAEWRAHRIEALQRVLGDDEEVGAQALAHGAGEVLDGARLRRDGGGGAQHVGRGPVPTRGPDA